MLTGSAEPVCSVAVDCGAGGHFEHPAPVTVLDEYLVDAVLCLAATLALTQVHVCYGVIELYGFL